MKVIIYTKTTCPFCDKAKDWLDAHLIEWKAQVFDDFAERQVMYDSLGLTGVERSVPQILVVDTVDGKEEVVEHIKGFTGLIDSGLENRAATIF